MSKLTRFTDQVEEINKRIQEFKKEFPTARIVFDAKDDKPFACIIDHLQLLTDDIQDKNR